eukprot:UN01817
MRSPRKLKSRFVLNSSKYVNKVGYDGQLECIYPSKCLDFDFSGSRVTLSPIDEFESIGSLNTAAEIIEYPQCS